MKRVLLVCVCLAVLACTTDERRSSLPLTHPAITESRKLDEIFEQYFEEYLPLFPIFATAIGDHRYDDQLGLGITIEHRAKQRELHLRFLDELARFARDRLDTVDTLNIAVFERLLKERLEGLNFSQHLLPLRQLYSTPIEFPLLGSGKGLHPFKSVKDYDNFSKRIAEFEIWAEAAIANMRVGMEKGVTQPMVVVERTLPQLDAMMVEEPKQSIFFEPILDMPDGLPASEKNRLAGVYADAIAQRIVPTYRRLRSFLQDEYLPKSRTTVAMSALPGGNDWYDHLVRSQTTTDLTPEEIFQLGMDEIDRIKKELERMRVENAYAGTLNEFARHLSSKAPPGHTRRDDLIKGYEAIREKITPRLPKLFGRLPTAPFEIRTIEEFRERSAPSQYWSPAPDGSRPGIFYVNAAGIEKSSRRASESLFLHEALPGHHFQISLQREQQNLPRFRRFGSYTAFGEGWALYAESLGSELGLYTEPYQYFSRLNSELFRAVRLVVDVGLHRKGWTRDQALRFMMETTMTGEAGAALEIDRYIAMPAQALAYKIGQLKISAIRAKAEKALGENFDIRLFHDELLKDGALPLDVLEAKMDAWIAKQQ